MARIITTLLPAFCLLSGHSLIASAHQDDDSDIDSRIDASFAITARNDAILERNDFWSIDGLMMGGEAYPYDKGITVDDASLRTTWRINENQFIRSTLSTHSHRGSYDAQIEKILIGQRVEDGENNWIFKAGLMNTDVTPSANWHSSTDTLTESPLLADVFFGRHGSDTGIAVSYLTETSVSGFELWNGNAWPATPGQGAASIFSRFTTDLSGLSLQTGLWISFANAELRADNRYVDGHNHGNGFTTATPPDIRFSGDTIMSGLYSTLLIPLTHSISSGISMEVIRSRSDGDILDTSRQAKYESDHLGYALESSLTMGKHSLLLRYEKLLLDNYLDGIAAPFLADDSGLVSSHEPARSSIGWEWYFSPQLTVKTEWINDHTQLDTANRFAISLSYKQTLWN